MSENPAHCSGLSLSQGLVAMVSTVSMKTERLKDGTLSGPEAWVQVWLGVQGSPGSAGPAGLNDRFCICPYENGNLSSILNAKELHPKLRIGKSFSVM